MCFKLPNPLVKHSCNIRVLLAPRNLYLLNSAVAHSTVYYVGGSTLHKFWEV